MTPDLWSLYDAMLRSRLLEEAVTGLWYDGLISGEMHLGTGEEAVVGGIVAHLRDGDAMALDQRGTPPLLMRGLHPVSILRELRHDGPAVFLEPKLLCTRDTIPFARHLDDHALPGVERIVKAARRLVRERKRE